PDRPRRLPVGRRPVKASSGTWAPAARARRRGDGGFGGQGHADGGVARPLPGGRGPERAGPDGGGPDPGGDPASGLRRDLRGEGREGRGSPLGPVAPLLP